MSMPGAEGAAAEAIRDDEAALARQRSVTARIDLDVVAAVRGAHAAHTDGTAALDSLQREIAAALASRTGLDNPAAAREFQRYLIDKLNEIRAIVGRTDLDDADKAELATALEGRYGDPIDDVGPLEFPAGDSDPAPAPGDSAAQPAQVGPTAQPPAAAAPMSMPAIPSIPSLGGGMPGLAPLGGLAALPGLAALADQPADPPADPPDSGYAGVIAEAVSGTPIADAFDHRGVDLPDPGTPVAAPLGAGQVVAGDIAVFEDRYALALGNGKALLDDQIQPIESIEGPGFLGWQHPPLPTGAR